MDGHYLSKHKLEEMILQAEKVKNKYTTEGMNRVLHLLYEIRHDSLNFRDKYGCS